jgi:hypothetical protein
MLIHRILVFFILFSSSAIMAQDPIRIPESRISMVIPDGFELSDNSLLLEGEHESILFLELYGESLDSSAKNFTKEKFQERGATVLDFQNVTIDGYEGRICKYRKQQYGMVSISLVFGHEDFSVAAFANLESANDQIEQQIITAFYSIEYDKLFDLDPFEIACFTLNQHQSLFKFVRANSSMFVFSLNGEVKESYEQEPTFTVTQFPAAGSSKFLFLSQLSELKNNGLSVYKRERTDVKEINGFECTQELIYGSLVNGAGVKLLMTSMVNSNCSLVTVGMAYDNEEKYLEEFRKLTNAITLRNN